MEECSFLRIFFFDGSFRGSFFASERAF